jgi:hypothetical protein
MKIVSLTGFILSVLFFAFALYLHFVVAPAAGIAESTDNYNSELLNKSEITDAERDAYYKSPERMELFDTMQMKTDYGIYALFGSILPFLLCLVAAIKKQKIAYLGLILSLTAFFIGAAYGSHMFS